MSFAFPGLCGLAWVLICVSLLMMCSTPFEMAMMAIAMLIFHKDADRGLQIALNKESKQSHEARIVKAGTALIVLLIGFCFALYALVWHYGST